MAIELVYEEAPGRHNSVPIATFDYFARVWVPGARELGLPTVPTLMHGVKLDAKGVDTLLPELAALSVWAKRKSLVELVCRVDHLAAELRRLVDAGVQEFSFG